MKYSELYGKTVINLSNSDSCGQVKQALISGETIEYLITDSGFKLRTDRIHSVKDSIAYLNDTLEHSDNYQLDYDGERKLLPVPGAPVINTDGTNLGTVCDYSIGKQWQVTRVITENSYIGFKRVYNCNTDVLLIKGRKPIVSLKETVLEDNRVTTGDTVMLSDDESINDDDNISEALTYDNTTLTHSVSDDCRNEDCADSAFAYTDSNEQVDELSAPVLDVHGAYLPTIISNYDFLIGRKVNKNIFDKNGDTVIVKNGIINSDTVEKCVACNRLAELAIYSDRN